MSTKIKFFVSLMGILTVVLSYLAFGHYSATADAGAYVEMVVNNNKLDDLLKPDKYDMVIGNAKANVALIEYSSMACPFCAKFHSENFEKLKKDYIDTGLVRYIHRDFPTSKASVVASMIAYCNSEKRLEWLMTFYKTQDTWLNKKDQVEAVKNIATLGGAIGVNACISDTVLEKDIMKTAYDAFKLYGVTSTPTFFVNTSRVEGRLTYQNIVAYIERALRESEKNNAKA